MNTARARLCFAICLYVASLMLGGLVTGQDTSSSETTVRFATFNVSFYRDAEGQLAEELQSYRKPDNPRRIAEIIQRVRPDVVLLNEFDFQPSNAAVDAFRKNFLEVGQGDQAPIVYPHFFTAPVNTGVDSGIDLDGDGKTKTGNDCYGFGRYPGQYGMVVLSRYPIDREQVRTFQKFLWKDMPGNLMPTKPGGNEPFYSAEATERFRLSSKSHWDIPIKVAGQTIHFLVSHPTPPVFDGPEDRNGRRNHDEIRIWSDYVQPGKANYLYDDQGKRGGLEADAKFVIAGDQNADPFDGDSAKNAARQLTDNPSISNNPAPESAGGAHYAKVQGQKNDEHQGPAAQDTGDFRDSSVGNLRLDYCLPSKNLKVTSAGVFWPLPEEAGADLIEATDHRLVWIDLQLD